MQPGSTTAHNPHTFTCATAQQQIPTMATKELMLEPLTVEQCEDIAGVYARRTADRPAQTVAFEGGLGPGERLACTSTVDMVCRVVMFANEGSKTLAIHAQQPGTIDESGVFISTDGAQQELCARYDAVRAAAHKHIAGLTLQKAEAVVFGKRTDTPAKRLAAIEQDVAQSKPSFMPSYTKDSLDDHREDALPTGPAKRAHKLQMWCDSDNGNPVDSLPAGSLRSAIEGSERPCVRAYDIHIGQETMTLGELLKHTQLRHGGDTFVCYAALNFTPIWKLNKEYRRVTFRPTFNSITWLGKPVGSGGAVKRPVVEFDDTISSMYTTAKRLRSIGPDATDE